MAWRAAEHLFPMPVEMLCRWGCTAGLRAAKRLAGEPEEPFASTLGVPKVLRDQEPVVVIQAKRAAVERLVVVGAEGQAVFLCVRAAVAMPVDVRGLDAKIGGTKMSVVSAHSATEFVDAEDGVAEGGVTRAAPRDLNVGHSDGIQYVLVKRRLPVILKQLLRDAVDEIGLGPELVIELAGKTAVGTDISDDGEARIVAVRRLVKIGLQFVALGNLPQAVRLQVPEGVLGPSGARWAEVFQQTADAFLDARKRDQAIFTALERR